MDFGMQRTGNSSVHSGGQSTVYTVFLRVVFACVISSLFLPFVLFIPTMSADTPMYIPSAPHGTTFGFVGIEYDYSIVTLNPDSYWMFDWGDGTNSSWLQLEENHTSIVQSHQWNVPGVYQLHVKYKGEKAPNGVWSDAMFVEISDILLQDFPTEPMIQTAKIQGVTGEEYTYSAITTDPHGYPVGYRFDYSTGNLSTWTPFVPSGTSSYVSIIWPQPGKYYLRAQARNEFGLESEWSNPIQVIIKESSVHNGTTVDYILLNNVSYQILYTSEHYGTLYNPSTGSSNDIYWNGAGVFLIDDDSDGRWEYLYLPAIGQIQPYIEPSPPQETLWMQLPWTLVLIIVICIAAVVGVIVVLIKKGVIYIYEEEIAEE
jgi:hypothetical protein